MEYLLRQNYNREEFYAYSLLKDILFKGQLTVIGDDGLNAVPDLATINNEIGCEVTVSEPMSVFNVINKIYLGKEYKYKKSKLRVCVNSDLLQVKRGEMSTQTFNISKQTLTENDKNEFLQQFEYILTKKIHKLNKGTYRNSKKNYLIILSDFKLKKNVSINDLQSICKKSISKYRKKFDAIFITFNNSLYMFDKLGEYSIVKNQQEFLKQKFEVKNRYMTM